MRYRDLCSSRVETTPTQRDRCEMDKRGLGLFYSLCQNIEDSTRRTLMTIDQFERLFIHSITALTRPFNCQQSFNTSFTVLTLQIFFRNRQVCFFSLSRNCHSSDSTAP